MGAFTGMTQAAGGFVPWGRPAASAFQPWSPDLPAPVAANEEPAIDEALVEAVRSDAYQAGFAAGHAAASAEIMPEREALRRLAESLSTLKPEPSGPLALLLVETVDRLVRQVVGEVAIDPNLLLSRAAAAAALVAEEARPCAIRLHPQDHGRLDGAVLPLPLVADPAVTPGAVVLETGEGWIEDGVAARLDAVRASLARIG